MSFARVGLARRKYSARYEQGRRRLCMKKGYVENRNKHGNAYERSEGKKRELVCLHDSGRVGKTLCLFCLLPMQGTQKTKEDLRGAFDLARDCLFAHLGPRLARLHLLPLLDDVAQDHLLDIRVGN